MSRKTKSTKVIVAALTALLIIPMAASAVTTVNWDCTVTVDTDGAGYLSVPDNVPYSFTTARNPALAVNGYGDAPDTNPIFYGGADWSGTGVVGLNDVPYHESSDQSWRWRLAAEAGNKFSAVNLWKKADFLNGQDAETVELDSSSSFSVNTDLYASDITNEVVRFVFEDAGSSMYISEAFLLLDAGATTTLSDPVAATWYAYDPSSDIFASIGSSVTPSFNNVTAAGVYFEFEVEVTSLSSKTLAMNNFQMDSIVAGSGGGSDIVLTARLQETDDLVSGTWTNSGHTVEWSVPSGSSNKFYRALLSL